MTDEVIQTSDDNKSFIAFILSFEARRLGVLSFNLGGLAWIGLNVAFGNNLLPVYEPCSFLHPNPLNVFCGALLLLAFCLALLAIKRGSLLPAFLTLTFVWSFIATIFRELTM